MSRKPIANPLLDVDGDFDPVNLVNPYAYVTGGGGPFDPLSITGCVLWLKADGTVYNTGTTQATNGQSVDTWVDASTASNNATGFGAIKPTFRTNILNGKPVLETNGTHGYMTGNLSITGTTLTAFVVSTTGSTGSAYGRLLALENASGGDFAATDACAAITLNGSQLITTFRNSNIPGNIATTDGVHFVATATYNGTNGLLRKNGTGEVSMSSSGSFAITKYGISAKTDGSSLAGALQLAEILVYNTALSTGDREAVEDYLGTKYGITITH